jgi:carboxylesterase type B
MGNTISYSVTGHELPLGSTKGAIKGLQYDSKSRRYTGIPYALPPTGSRRWQKPHPLSSSHSYSKLDGSPFDAIKFGPICAQNLKYTSAGKHEDPDNVYSEDCLRTNIWTSVPKDGEEVKGKKWPVMLWLHGGWFQMGDPSHEPGMDPTELISTGGLNAIVVAIEYRLNMFGFLACEELKEESGGEAVGNYGLWDQMLAMEVRTNTPSLV